MIHAICWTLLHSVWQGLLAALLAGTVLLTTRKSSPRLRYNLLVLVFFGLLGLTGGTFIWELGQRALAVAGRAGAHGLQAGLASGGGAPNGATGNGARRESDASNGAQFATSWASPYGDAAPANPTGPEARSTYSASVPGEKLTSHGPVMGPNLGLNSSPGISRWAAVETSSNTQPWYDRLSAFCDGHSLLIVSAWLVILLIRLARTGLSLGYVRKIRSYKTAPAPAEWQHRITELARNLGLGRPITLLESALIRVPMVIGFLKPVILVPLGILAQMPQDQLEAVLLHELAHIRRADYLVNILQGIVEALLFFNPAIWWLSSLIREERENCCDDIAILATSNKSNLIHALVAFQEYSVMVPQAAVAFPGKNRNHLLDRVKRIVYNRNKTLNAMEKILLGACLLTAGSLTLAFSPLGARQQAAQIATLFYSGKDTLPPPPPVPPSSPVPPAPVPAAPAPPAPPVPALAPTAPVPTAPVLAVVAPIAPVQPVIATDTLPLVAPKAPIAPVSPIAPLNPIAGEPAFMPEYIGNSLSGGTFNGSLQMHDGTLIYARGIWSKDNLYKYYLSPYKIVKEGDVLKEVYVNGAKIPDAQLPNYKTTAEKVVRQLEYEQTRDQKRSTNGTGAYSSAAYGTGASASYGTGAYTANYPNATYGKGASTATPAAHASISTGTATSTISVNEATSTDATPEAAASPVTPVEPNRVDPILDDILSQGLAKDPANLSFSLDNSKLLINGVRQSDNIFKTYKEKYIDEEGRSFSYKRKGGSTSSSVSLNRK